jgi:hypothetical protein
MERRSVTQELPPRGTAGDAWAVIALQSTPADATYSEESAEAGPPFSVISTLAAGCIRAQP